MKNRKSYIRIWEEISRDKNMIFLSGPRQTGKTTLTKIISNSFSNSLYFNWDIHQDKIKFLKDPTFFEQMERKDSSTPLVIFDEIHKYKGWKNYLKGVYDQFFNSYKFIISGSGRLDMYQKGGDSLAGRYYLFHLFPFTISELGNCSVTIEEFLKNPLDINIERNHGLKDIWAKLSILSGFPEPFLSDKVTTYRRWSNNYSHQLIREDIRELTDIKSISDMETLYLLLPSKIGSPISVPSFAQDLHASYNSIQSWLSVMERFFLIFNISPWTEKINRAIQKERKVYLFDTPLIKNDAARLENMVAIELWRAVTSWNDIGYGKFSLHFIKNKEKQEVDFLIANDNEPIVLIEVKLSERQPSASLKNFQRALNIPAVQLIGEGDSYQIISNKDNSILIAPAYHWLCRLP